MSIAESMPISVPSDGYNLVCSTGAKVRDLSVEARSSCRQFGFSSKDSFGSMAGRVSQPDGILTK
jgi:hypothetical protein